MGEGWVGVTPPQALRSSTNITPPQPLPIKGRGDFSRSCLAAFFLTLATPATAQDKTPPYWASIASGEAMMRSGPGKNYPGVWLYKRRDLPIRVVKTYPNWRLIEDPDGTKGWMLVTLLSDRRTAIVKPGETRDIHAEASEVSRVAYKAEPGVVGHIDKCDGNWCHIAIGKREGFIRMADVWGVGAGEVVD
jgi:SH3-like domain-containing protein